MVVTRKYTPDDLNNAIHEMKNKGWSFYSVAKKHNVPCSTLHRHVNSPKNRPKYSRSSLFDAVWSYRNRKGTIRSNAKKFKVPKSTVFDYYNESIKNDRYYSKKKKTCAYTKDDLKNALEDYNTNGLSVATISAKYNVPKSTLYRHIKVNKSDKK